MRFELVRADRAWSPCGQRPCLKGSEKGEVLLRGVGTLRCFISTECICAVAAWWFDDPHQKVVPGSRILRCTSHVSYTRSPLEDSRLFGPSPWKILRHYLCTNGSLSNPAPGENLLSGNLVMETGCTQEAALKEAAPESVARRAPTKQAPTKNMLHVFESNIMWCNWMENHAFLMVLILSQHLSEVVCLFCQCLPGRSGIGSARWATPERPRDGYYYYYYCYYYYYYYYFYYYKSKHTFAITITITIIVYIVIIIIIIIFIVAYLLLNARSTATRARSAGILRCGKKCYMYVYIYIYIYVCIYIYIYIYVHTYTCIYIYLYLSFCTSDPFGSSQRGV